jgi:ATP-dependent Lon protease
MFILLVFTLSRLLANNLDTIPAPLLDRMEVLEVSGYVSEEKCVIADKYLGPQAKEASGLKDTDVLLEPSTVDVLIKYYCRESGVRNLKKHIEKVGVVLMVLLASHRSQGVVDLPEGCIEAHPRTWRDCLP